MPTWISERDQCVDWSNALLREAKVRATTQSAITVATASSPNTSGASNTSKANPGSTQCRAPPSTKRADGMGHFSASFGLGVCS